MTLMDYAKANVRTIVPFVVAWLITFALKHGVDLHGYQAAVTVVVGAVYYATVRLAERYVTPKFGWLLGLAQQPVYAKVRTRKDAPVPQHPPVPATPRPVRHHVRPGLTVVTIPEIHSATAGRLGRHVEHDQRSRAFAITRTDTPLRSVSWKRHVPPFDQGQLGSCTGNAMAGVLSTAPFTHRYTETRAVTLYEAATRLDNVPGAYPPDDTGSSGLAVAKAAQQTGLISSYRHAFGIEDTLHALQQGACIAGTNWYSDMDTPDADGLVRVGGAVRGGHEYALVGVDMEAQRVLAVNSWGTSWGRRGYFSISVEDFTRLLAEQGDVVLPLA